MLRAARRARAVNLAKAARPAGSPVVTALLGPRIGAAGGRNRSQKP
jgi:hypothetical protein